MKKEINSIKKENEKMRKEVLTYVRSTTYDILLNKMYPDNEATMRPAEEIERLIKQGHIIEWRENNKSMELNLDMFTKVLLPLITPEEAITIIEEGTPEILVEVKLPEVATVIQESTEEIVAADEVIPNDEIVEDQTPVENDIDETSLDQQESTPVEEEVIEEVAPVTTKRKRK